MPLRLLATALFGACAIAPLTAAGAAAQSEAGAAITVIRAGRLVDVAAGRVHTDQVIVVRGRKIVAVGAAGSTPLPAGATVLDLSNKTVLPGLIDTHTHVTSDPATPPYHDYGISVPRRALMGAHFARDTLLSGVTTIRNVGSSAYTDIALRDAIAAGDVIGPRILASGPALGITGGHCDDNMMAPEYHERGEGVADGPWAVREMVRSNVKYGADVIKYCGTGGVFSKGTRVGAQQFTAEEVAAIVDEAHMHGRKVAVHAHGANGIKVALRAGVDTVEHASLIDAEGLELARRNGAFLSMDIYNSEYTQSEGPKRGELEEFLRKDREVAQVQRDAFRKAVSMGIRLTMGTDTGVHRHADAPKQLAWMVRYGMTPMQAIQAATRVGAEALGIDGEVGQIAPGYSADIVAVTADPLADIGSLGSVEFVMKEGVVYKQ
ncbi:MAG TPA: amidohydrolase family protein [Steroidobacteraceae bacterium]|nr:amidohydrolase family protein [Steroidobacteraceae bacterium]